MAEIKKHLKDLYRTKHICPSRKDFLHLDMNESVSGLPEGFVKKVLNNVDPGFLAMYPEYEIFQDLLASHNNIGPENICLSNGSDGAIKYIFGAYISKGDKVLLTDPTFAMHPVYSKMFDALVINISYNQDLSFSTNDFLDKISKDIKLAVIVNPNNPTVTAIAQDGLVAIIEKESKANTLVITDDAYFYFYPKSIIEKVKVYDNLIVLRTFSKLCGIASLRLGYAAACPDIIENLRKVRPTYDINGLAVLFAHKMLESPDIIKGLIKEVNDGKKYLVDILKKSKIAHKEGNANFVLIKCGKRVNEIIEKLSEKNILAQGGFNQDFMKQYIRVSGGARKDMERFWKVFIGIWEK